MQEKGSYISVGYIYVYSQVKSVPHVTVSHRFQCLLMPKIDLSIPTSTLDNIRLYMVILNQFLPRL